MLSLPKGRLFYKLAYNYFMLILFVKIPSVCTKRGTTTCIILPVWLTQVDLVCNSVWRNWWNISYFCIMHMTTAVDLWGSETYVEIPVSLKPHTSFVIKLLTFVCCCSSSCVHLPCLTQQGPSSKYGSALSRSLLTFSLSTDIIIPRLFHLRFSFQSQVRLFGFTFFFSFPGPHSSPSIFPFHLTH